MYFNHLHIRTDFHRCFLSLSAAKQCPLMAGGGGGKEGSTRGVKFCYSCSSEFCWNLAAHCRDLYVCGFDMKMLERLVWNLSFNVAPLKSGLGHLAYVPKKVWRTHFWAPKGAGGLITSADRSFLSSETLLFHNFLAFEGKKGFWRKAYNFQNKQNHLPHWYSFTQLHTLLMNKGPFSTSDSVQI